MSLVKSVVARYLAAAPLDDYYSMPSPTKPKTVGWGREKQKTFLSNATKFFQSRKDSWAIIVSPHAWSEDDPEILAYVESNPKLKRSKIIVVDTEALQGDGTSPSWILLHDIVGHGVETSADPKAVQLAGKFSSDFHEALPAKYQISKDMTDFLPDIYSAIFFHDISSDIVLEALQHCKKHYHGMSFDSSSSENKLRVLKEVFRSMQEDVARWSSRFNLGVPRKVFLWK